MNNLVEIREVKQHEIPDVLNLVGSVVIEMYDHLFLNDTPVPAELEPWKLCHVAIVDGQIVGVVLATEGRIDDLWLLKSHRGHRIGSQLLALAESQILRAGYTVGKLRVVSENKSAHRFYKARGWKDKRVYHHELFKFEMIDMEKRVGSGES